MKDGHRVLCAPDILHAEVMDMAPHNHPSCPSCKTSDLITIAMTVGGAELAFSTCHECEAKWWFRDGEPVQLTSVIGLVGVR
jgi:DNA polymerase III alpha subunit (gram-positive type)